MMSLARALEDLSAADFLQLRRLLRRRLPPVRSSRHRVAAGQLERTVDFRRSLRNAKYGELLDVSLRGRRRVARQVAVLADVSGSMSRYLMPQLRLLWLLIQLHPTRCEAFVFSTRLWRVTPLLRSENLAEVEDVWSGLFSDRIPGGTRIGDSLLSFYCDWGRRRFSRDAYLLIISDGIDRGDPQVVANILRRLSGRFRRMVWFHPHAGEDGFLPLTASMKAAGAHIHLLLPLASTADVGVIMDQVWQVVSGAANGQGHYV
jgi:hypothetical protein